MMYYTASETVELDADTKELFAYRRIGTVEHLRWLRQEEIRKERRIKRIKSTLKIAALVNIAFFSFWGFVHFALSLFA